MVNIGGALRSSCVLCQARRIRHGPFSVKNSLLLKQCVVPQSIYDRFNQLRSDPPERDFDNEDEYRKFVLSQLVDNSGEPTNLFENLVNCTLDGGIQKLMMSEKMGMST